VDSISIIIPAFNEERYIGETLTSLDRAKKFMLKKKHVPIEILVVDNDSEDLTVNVAKAFGVTIISEIQHNIARVRNTGANLANGNILIFIDADTIVPENLLYCVYEAMADSTCLGGAVNTNYRPVKLTTRLYLNIWRIVGHLAGIAQGATQFCRRHVFFELKGYDESLYMGEDVDFYCRLKRFAKQQRARVRFLEGLEVLPSTRRFDQCGLWRTLIWTNPIYIQMFRRRKKAWKGWYQNSPR